MQEQLDLAVAALRKQHGSAASDIARMRAEAAREVRNLPIYQFWLRVETELRGGAPIA